MQNNNAEASAPTPTPGPWESMAVGLGAALLPLFVFLADRYWHLQLDRYALMPRAKQGLIGILTAPLLHGSWHHLMSNFSALFALVSLGYYHFKHFFGGLLLFIWLASGLWAWGFARPSYHLGASGIIYGLAAFCFVSGIVSKNLRLRALALLIAFLYGGMIWGVWPLPFNEPISWEMHLTGMLSGILAVWVFRKELPQPDKPSWDEEDDEETETEGEAWWKEENDSAPET